MSYHGSKGKKRERGTGEQRVDMRCSLESIKQMSVKEFLKALAEAKVITPGDSFETKLSEEEVDGDVFVKLCSQGPQVVRSFGFSVGQTIRLAEFYSTLLDQQEKQKKQKLGKAKPEISCLEKGIQYTDTNSSSQFHQGPFADIQGQAEQYQEFQYNRRTAD